MGWGSHTTISRGRLGVQKIQAATLDESVRAWGYIHARDRAFQMDFARRSAAGRLAELLGPSRLSHDRFQRVLGFNRVASLIFARLPTAQQQLLNTYAKGVNDQLSRRRFPSLAHILLRIPMDLWSATDSLLIFLGLYQALAFDLPSRQSEFVLKSQLPSAIADFLTTDVDPAFVEARREACPLKEIRQFLVSATREPVEVVEPPMAGSNCWTIDGAHTYSGKPILACDLHLIPTIPNHWHRIEMSVGDMRTLGVAIPGLPIVVAGSNGSISWGVTNMPGDTIDLVAVEECGPTQTVRHERIKVRGAADEELQVNETEVGPVLSQELAGKKLVLVWSGIWSTAIDLGLAKLAWCNDFDQALEIARQAGGVPLNVHLAGESGDTAQTVTGRIPQRINGGLKPHCYVPSAEVGVIRPGTGDILVTANNRRYNQACRLPTGWNHSPGFRAQRITQVMQSRSDWTEKAIFNVQHDVRSEMLDFYRDLALEVLNRTSNVFPQDIRDDAQAALLKWDGRLAAESYGAPLLMQFRQDLRSRFLAPFVRACLRAEPEFKFSWRNTEYVVRCLIDTEDELLLPGPAKGWWEKLGTILFHSTEELQRRYGRCARDLVWRDVAKRSLTHPLSSGIYRFFWQKLGLPSDGDDDCINVNTSTLTVSMRLVVSPGREEDGIFSMPGGQSESPISRHYSDQHRIWCAEVASPLLSKL
jgi:penicillin amidase